MIRSFRDKTTESVYFNIVPKRFSAELAKQARRKLKMIDAAAVLNDLASPPGNRLEALKGDRKGQFSIRINDQYRVCFEWKDGAHNVEICDYH